MKLKGGDFKVLQDAVMAAYPDEPKLRRMIRQYMQQNLAAIAGGSDLSETVFNLLVWAESRGKIEALIRAALEDNPESEEMVDVAARLGVNGPAPSSQDGGGDAKPRDDKLRVLFLMANPSDQTRLALDVEHREIRDAIEACALRDRIELHVLGAVRTKDLFPALLKVRPQVVHFSGHGFEQGGILLVHEDNKAHFVEGEAIAGIFGALSAPPRLVVLNSCWSSVQAGEIVKHVDCVMGMQYAVTNRAAIEFAREVYRALGFRETVKTAFDHGVAILGTDEKRDERGTPRISAREGVDLTTLRLL